jgi:hypothetical protein
MDPTKCHHKASKWYTRQRLLKLLGFKRLAMDRFRVECTKQKKLLQYHKFSLQKSKNHAFLINGGPLAILLPLTMVLCHCHCCCCWPSGMYWLAQSSVEPTPSLDAGFSAMAVFATTASPPVDWWSSWQLSTMVLFAVHNDQLPKCSTQLKCITQSWKHSPNPSKHSSLFVEPSKHSSLFVAVIIAWRLLLRGSEEHFDFAWMNELTQRAKRNS